MLSAVLVAVTLGASPGAQRFGLTADGSAVLFPGFRKLFDESEDREDDSDPLCELDLTVVRDLATKAQTTYLVSKKGTNCKGAKNEKDLLPASQLVTFLAAHPLSPLYGVSGPHGGKVVALHPNCATLSCTGGRCETSGISKGDDCGGDGMGSNGEVSVALQRADGRSFVTGVARMGNGMMASRWSTTVETSWLPDESKAAVIWLRHGTGGRSGGWREGDATVVDFGQVRVSLLGYADPKVKLDPKDHRPTADAATDAAFKTLSGLGDYYVNLGYTRDPHPETTVYAGKGYETAGAKVAAALGGAKVQPLDWKADADLVVACVLH